MALHATTRLPRGRHGIPREQVLASQRGRMLQAMIEVVAERGYARATVADVLRGAGVSRETFYEHFQDKHQCFLASLDGAAGLLASEVGDAFADTREPIDRLDAVLGAYLQTLADEPAAARAFLIEAYGAGHQAVMRRVATLNRFVDLVFGFVGANDPAGRFRCEAYVGMVSSLVTMRVAVGDGASLPQLREPLLELGRDLGLFGEDRR